MVLYAVLYMSKIVIRKQFTTIEKVVCVGKRCALYVKDSNSKAIHNRYYGRSKGIPAVLYMSKIVIRKQFTTELKTGLYLQ